MNEIKQDYIIGSGNNHKYFYRVFSYSTTSDHIFTLEFDLQYT